MEDVSPFLLWEGSGRRSVSDEEVLVECCSLFVVVVVSPRRTPVRCVWMLIFSGINSFDFRPPDGDCGG